MAKRYVSPAVTNQISDKLKCLRENEEFLDGDEIHSLGRWEKELRRTRELDHRSFPEMLALYRDVEDRLDAAQEEAYQEEKLARFLNGYTEYYEEEDDYWCDDEEEYNEDPSTHLYPSERGLFYDSEAVEDDYSEESFP